MGHLAPTTNSSESSDHRRTCNRLDFQIFSELILCDPVFSFLGTTKNMINEALRLIRVFHDLSQKKLAESLRVSNSHLSEIESGKKTPSIELIEKYANIDSCRASFLRFY